LAFVAAVGEQITQLRQSHCPLAADRVPGGAVAAQHGLGDVRPEGVLQVVGTPPVEVVAGDVLSFMIAQHTGGRAGCTPSMPVRWATARSPQLAPPRAERHLAKDRMVAGWLLPVADLTQQRIIRRPVPGGLLSQYRRAA
jgi:hypothetical protein